MFRHLWVPVIDWEHPTRARNTVSMNPELAQIFELSLSEKLQWVEDLWDNIALETDQIPVLDWQKEELARRKAAYLENPDAGSSWETVKDRIHRRHHEV